jgi:SAM-dependent methyltransferase
MAFSLDQIVPWGRSLDEYVGMFDLTEADFSGRILGCGDGPASFNAEAARLGFRVISCDPVYQFSAAQIEGRVRETYDTIMEELRPNMDSFIWDTFGSPEGLGRARLAAMQTFLADYGRGRQEGRYVNASLPALPFPDKAFDLALCSHLLFLYSDHLSLAFHKQAIKEMCRVAGEVRVFPVRDLACRESVHLRPLIAELQGTGYESRFVRVGYEFQKGANTFLGVNQ